MSSSLWSRLRLWQTILNRLFPWRRPRRVPALRRPSIRLALEALEDRLAPATFLVPSKIDFAGAIAAATSNNDSANTIEIAAGTLTVVGQKIAMPAGKSLTIVGAGSGATILTANGQGRVLEFDGLQSFGTPPSAFSLSNLTITGGKVQGDANNPDALGAGLLVNGGVVKLTNVNVQNNTALGANFTGTQTQAGASGKSGGAARGGGVYMTSGQLTLNDTMITANKAAGGRGQNGGAANATFGAGGGGNGGAAQGGGLYLSGVTLNGQRAVITNNQAVGGAGGNGAVPRYATTTQSGPAGPGGSAAGAGIYDRVGSALMIGGSVAGNHATGGAAGHSAGHNNPGVAGAGRAGGVYVGGGSLTLFAPVFKQDTALGAAGGNGGSASAGGLEIAGGKATIYGGTISQCKAAGGAGADGAVATGNFYVLDGRAGGNGGSARGGGIYVGAATVTVIAAQVANDSAVGGSAGKGLPGSAGAQGSPPNGSGIFRFLGTSPSGKLLYHNSGGSLGNNGGAGGHGGAGGAGGDGQGGGIYVLAGGSLTLTRANMASDSARGAAGGTGANGAKGGDGGKGGNAITALFDGKGRNELDGGGPGGNGGAGGNGGNGGAGGQGGGAFGGALYVAGGLFAYQGSIAGLATAGNGGHGGDAKTGGNGAAGGAGAGTMHGAGGTNLGPFLSGAAGPGGNGGSSLGGNGGNAKGGGIYLAAGATALTLDGVAPSGTSTLGARGAAGAAGGGGKAGGKAGQATDGANGVAAGSSLQNDSSIALGTTGPTATQLVVSSMPPSIGAGDFPNSVYVLAEDANGNLAGDYPGTVTLRLAANPGKATLVGKLTAQAVGGVAVFTGLSLAVPAAGYTLTATSSDKLPANTTNPFVVTGDTWTGKGNNAHWNNPQNWAGGVVPGPNQTLYFPAGAAQTTTIDDMPNLAVDQIIIGASYQFQDMNGDAVDLETDITVLAGNTTFAIPTDFGQVAAAARASITPFAQPAQITVAVGANAGIDFADPTSGQGEVVKTGPGELRFQKDTETGDLLFEAGTLRIDSVDALQWTGALHVRVAAGDAATLVCADAVTLNNPVYLEGGTLAVQGQLTIASAVTVTDPSCEIDPASSAVVSITGSLTGASIGDVLHVGGAGRLMLNDALNCGVTTVSNKAQLRLGSQVSGVTLLTLNGGTLASGTTNQLTQASTITLIKGTLQLSADDALGAAQVVVDPVHSGDLTIKASRFALSNTVLLQGAATVNLIGNLTLSGAIAVQAAGELDVNGNLTVGAAAPIVLTIDSITFGWRLTTVAAGSTINLLGRISGTGTIYLSGPGTVTLGGALTNAGFTSASGSGYPPILAVDDRADTVNLASTLSGSGNIAIEPLAEVVSSGIGNYTGTVYLDGGTLIAKADNAFGGAKLDVMESSTLMSPLDPVSGFHKAVTLGNSLWMFSGDLTVNSVQMTITGDVNVASTPGVFKALNPQGSSTLVLGTITGNDILTLGGQGVTYLTGTLNSTALAVKGRAVLKSTFGDGANVGSITVSGGQLSSSGVGTFTGQINLVQGTLVVHGAGVLGTGTLSVAPTGPVHITVFGGIAILANVLQLGGTLGLSGGALTFTNTNADTPNTVATNTTIQTPGTLTLQGGLSFGTLRLTGGGKLILGGVLDATTVTVPSKASFAELTGLSATNGGTVVDATGKKIL